MMKGHLSVWIILGVSGVALAALQVQRGESQAVPLTALDYAEIEQLNAAYGHFIDTGENDGYAWADLFTPDGLFTRQMGDRYEGREQLAELARNTGRGPKYVAHYVTNVMIEPAPAGAVGRAHCVVIRFPDDKMSDQDSRPSVTGAGCRYQDVYAKTADGWRFKLRAVTVSSSSRQPESGTVGQTASPSR